MSLEYIKQLVNTKYDEINNMKNEDEKAKNLEEFIYDSLDKYNKNKVMYFIKQLFDIKIQYIKDDLYEKENTQMKICRNDEEFKKSIHDLYKTCIICDSGDCHKSAYEVAHIWDFAKCDSLESKYDVNNGILLCANMHKYFDSKCGLLKFKIISNINDNSNTVICKAAFCESISNSSYYKKYNGKQIKFNKKNIMYLEKKNLENQ